MKVCVIQPYYSMRQDDMDSCYQGLCRLMDECDPSLDLIVLPEYCDIPASTDDYDAFYSAIEAYNGDIRARVIELARRCHAMVFANFADRTPEGWRNTTFAFDREGRETGRYYKAHPAPSEFKTREMGGNGMDCSYAFEPALPAVVEMEGLRFCFLTCYDFYMYEYFPQLARLRPDIIIGCSHQRTDTHHTLDVIGQFLCYQTNAWLVRSAVSLGPDSPVCGCSMVVSPAGQTVLNMKNDVGLGVTLIDPSAKHLKPAGFRGASKSHPAYIEEGRRPWLYRQGGSMMIPDERTLPYPRICAHRGFSTIAPENSMPAFGAAVALGAEEIEFDLWDTRDGELVSIHDASLDRVSDGTGRVWEHTLSQLQGLDFGSKMNESFAGLSIVRFEDILRQFAGTVIMNIHVKIWDHERPDPMYSKIAGLLRAYDCERHCYVMSTNDRALEEFHEVAPDIARCVGWDGDEDPLKMPQRAMKLGCEKIQLFKPYFNQQTVDMARANRIRTNVFFADDPQEAIHYLEMGIDAILTNDYQRVSRRVRDYLNARGVGQR